MIASRKAVSFIKHVILFGLCSSFLTADAIKCVVCSSREDQNGNGISYQGAARCTDSQNSPLLKDCPQATHCYTYHGKAFEYLKKPNAQPVQLKQYSSWTDKGCYTDKIPQRRTGPSKTGYVLQTKRSVIFDDLDASFDQSNGNGCTQLEYNGATQFVTHPMDPYLLPISGLMCVCNDDGCNSVSVNGDGPVGKQVAAHQAEAPIENQPPESDVPPVGAEAATPNDEGPALVQLEGPTDTGGESPRPEEPTEFSSSDGEITRRSGGESKGLSMGVLIGIIIAALFLILGVCVLSCILCCPHAWEDTKDKVTEKIDDIKDKIEVVVK